MMLGADAPANPIIQVLTILSNLIVCAGIVVQIVGMLKLRGAVDAKDVTAVTLLAIGTGLSLIILFFGELSNVAVNVLKFVLGSAMMVMTITGAYSLKTSLTFPYKANKGAGMLLAGFIIAIAGGFLGGFAANIAPIAGAVILLLAMLTAGILYIAGWYNIKTADPDDYLAKYQAAEEQITTTAE